MTSEAISIILNKAWENNSRALIFIKDRGKFEINPELWNWKMKLLFCHKALSTSRK